MITFNTTALWDLNKTSRQDGDNSALLQGDVCLKKLFFYIRYEFAQKTTGELVLNLLIYGGNTISQVNAITLGLNYVWLK